MKKYLFALYFAGSFLLLPAQERVIHGKISTLENIAVAKAKISSKVTKQEVLSDSAGLFSIQCSDKDKLKITAHGFYNLKVKISGKDKFVLANLKLKPGAENREYALGYGHITDATRLNAIGNLNSDDFDFSRYNDMYELIRGQFPGVEVRGGEIVIRNTVTMTSNIGALIVLDGRAVDLSTFESLVPSDVKSINIVKDASAAMYGVKGGNGVVVIETKRGGD